MNDNEKLLHMYRGMCEIDNANERLEWSKETLKLYNEILALMKPEPVRWIDGAVRTNSFIKIMYVFKDEFVKDDYDIHIGEIRYTAVKWDDILWIPASDFPMPLPPEQVIEKCPFCGVSCHTQKLPTMVIVQCDMCMYQTSGRETEREVIELHNDLCRRLKVCEMQRL